MPSGYGYDPTRALSSGAKDYASGFSGRIAAGSTGGQFGKSATSQMWKTIQATGDWNVDPGDVEYRQFTSRGGRFAEKANIPTQGARVVPVIATQSGTGPTGKTMGEGKDDRMGAPMGFATKNPDVVKRYMGITSSYDQGRMDPNRLQLYGRLGDTASRTLQMHPELYKPLPGGHPSMKNTERVSTGYSMITAPTRPSDGSAEGSRYTEILRKEIAGANMVYDPLAGAWGSRNSMRWFLNKLMTPGSVENESMLTGVSPRRVRESRERAAAQEMFKGYSPDMSWMLRLKQGQYQESGPTKDTMAPSIRTYEGTQNLGELGVRDKGRA